MCVFSENAVEINGPSMNLRFTETLAFCRSAGFPEQSKRLIHDDHSWFLKATAVILASVVPFFFFSSCSCP